MCGKIIKLKCVEEKGQTEMQGCGEGGAEELALGPQPPSAPMNIRHQGSGVKYCSPVFSPISNESLDAQLEESVRYKRKEFPEGKQIFLERKSLKKEKAVHHIYRWFFPTNIEDKIRRKSKQNNK